MMQGSVNASPVPVTPNRLLLRNFAAALLLLAIPLISQILIQIQTSQQQTDAHVLNVAGRQRTLSQLLARDAHLLTDLDQDYPLAADRQPARERLIQRLQTTLEQWVRVADGLRFGDEGLNLPGSNSPEVDRLYAEIEAPFTVMRQAAVCILSLSGSVVMPADPTCTSSIALYVQAIEDNSDAFLQGMEQIVSRYEVEASSRVNELRNVQLALGGLTLLVLFTIIFFVFRPMEALVVRSVAALRESERRLQRRANALETVSRVSAAAATTLDTELLLQNVADLTRSSFKLYHVQLYLLDEKNRQLVLAAGAGEAGRQMKAEGYHIPLDKIQSLVAMSARDRQVNISNDVSTTPGYVINPLLPRTRAEMAVPMLIGEALIGVLDVQSDEANHFSNEDARIHMALAEQIAVALENARVYGQVQSVRKAEQTARQESERRADELKLVADVSAAASAILDIEVLLPSVAELTKSTFSLYHAHVYLLDDRFEYLVLAAGAGDVGKIMKQQGHRIALRHESSLVAKAGRSRRAVVVNDVSESPEWMANPLLPDTRAEMALPMIVGNTLIGVLDVQSDQLAYFTDTVVLVQTALADQVAIAIQNARLFQETRLSQTVIDNNNDSVLITDTEQRVIYVNPRFTEMFGYTPQEMVGQSPRLLQGQLTQRERLDSIRAAIERQQPIRLELINYRKDGTPFWIELSISPVVDNKGRLTHYIGIEQDITDRKTLEMQREHMLRQAEEQAELERAAAERLREIDRLKSDFLASMSHELRTPLNSILGYSEVMLDGIDGELPESALEDVQAIYDSGQHLLSLINDILDLAKIEAGRMELDFEPTPLDMVIEEVQRSSRIMLKGKPVALNIDVAPDFPWLYADRVRLRQIMNNLVSNAIKFTDQGEVKISAQVQPAFGFAHISVYDTGIGIEEGHLGIIFEQFRQVDSGSTRRTGGTGLGLPITKRLVEMHGGEIWVESRPGSGSTFHFSIPLSDSKIGALPSEAES